MFRHHRARFALAAGIGIATALFTAGTAAAEWSDTECDPAEQSCEVSAGTDADPGGAAGAPSDESDGGSGHDDGEQPPSVSDPGTPDQDVCESWIDETDAESDYRAGTRPSEDHVLMHTSCKYADGTGSIDSEWVEVDEDGNPVVDPAVLAQQAADQLQLPAPQIVASPPDLQVVHVPTWVWLGGDSLQTQDATASVPGTSVTATATPVQVLLDFGDGTTVKHDGACTKWTPDVDPEDPSPDCGHTYTQSSAGAAGGEYPMTVTVVWAVSWSGGGDSGTEPDMTTTADTSWPVAQSPALNK